MVLTPQELLAAARRAKDYSDLMLELSGFTAGIIPRFLRPEQIEQIREARGLPSKTGETPAERAWQRYLELTDTINRQISIAQRAIDRALLKSERRLQDAQEALERMRERATVDDKGRRVYRTEDRQRGFTDDGHELSRGEFEAIHWKEDAPTWEQRQAAGNRFRKATEERDEILRYKERVDYYAQRMGSGEVLSPDELDTIHKDLDAMPQAVKAELETDHSAGGARMARAEASGLSGEFALSAEDLADIRRDGPADRPSGPRPEFAPKPQ